MIDVLQICLDDIKLDDISLHDVVREFSGFYKEPNLKDLENALKTIRKLTERYGVKIISGENLKEFDLPFNELEAYILNLWNTGRYEEINYGLWLTLDTN